MKATVKKTDSGDVLVVEVPLISPPKPSATGRTLLIASSGGNKEVPMKVNGQNVHIGLNAYIYAKPKASSASDSE